MKTKILGMIMAIIIPLMIAKNVYAKETIHSINKYNEEEFKTIIRSYDNKGKKDGFVTAGTYLKEEKDNNDYLMVVKYSPNGKKMWEYVYGKIKENTTYDMTYLYDAEENINGYIIVVTNSENETYFVILNLEGKKILEKESSLPKNISIERIITSYSEDKQINGYLVLGTNDNENNKYSVIMKYDLNLNQEYSKTYENSTDIILITDFITLKRENSVGYIGIKKIEKENKIEYQLIRYNLQLEEEKIIKTDFEETDTPHLLQNNDSYIVYGITNELKLGKHKTSSYYLVKMTENDEEEWETIGTTPVPLDKTIELKPIYEKDNSLKEYVIMYTNDEDSSIELVRISIDGVIGNKIKKITNQYYDINSFMLDNDTLYFVGQINCPDDDNCDYDKNSLFLISNEEKVIEVKEKDSRNIMLLIGCFLVGTFIIGLWKRRNTTD